MIVVAVLFSTILVSANALAADVYNDQGNIALQPDPFGAVRINGPLLAQGVPITQVLNVDLPANLSASLALTDATLSVANALLSSLTAAQVLTTVEATTTPPLPLACSAFASAVDSGAGAQVCSCNTGYRGNGFTCTPIDWCGEGHSVCGSNANCVTGLVPGTYTCSCREGYFGDGSTCTPADVLSVSRTLTSDSVESLNVHDGAEFGTSVANIGDVDGDGNDDLASGARFSNATGATMGSLFVLLMNGDGESFHTVSQIELQLQFEALSSAQFGFSVTGLGDINGDGVRDIAVGAPYEALSNGSSPGVVFLVMLHRNASVLESIRVEPIFGHTAYGSSLVFVESKRMLLVGGSRAMGLEALYLSATNSTIVERVAVPALNLLSSSSTWISLADIGDLDDDDNTEIAAGMYQDSQVIIFSFIPNALHILSTISSLTNGYVIGNNDQFGVSVARASSANLPALPDLWVGAKQGGSVLSGVVYQLRLSATGEVIHTRRFDPTPSTTLSTLFYGRSIASFGEPTETNGVFRLMVGVTGYREAGNREGAVTVLFFNSTQSTSHHSLIRGTTAFGQSPTSAFGSAMVSLGDVDSNGVVDVGVGAPTEGAFFTLLMRSDGSVLRSVKLRQGFGTEFGAATATIVLQQTPYVVIGEPGTTRGTIHFATVDLAGKASIISLYTLVSGSGQRFGAALAAIPDIDGNGIDDLAVGAPSSDGTKVGDVYILRMSSGGTVITSHAITPTGGSAGAMFGSALCALTVGSGATGMLAVGMYGTDGSVPSDVMLLRPTWQASTSTVIVSTLVSLRQELINLYPNVTVFRGALVAAGDTDDNMAGDFYVGVPSQEAVLRVLITDDSIHAKKVEPLRMERTGSDTQPTVDIGTALAPATDLDSNSMIDLLVGFPSLNRVETWLLNESDE